MNIGQGSESIWMFIELQFYYKHKVSMPLVQGDPGIHKGRAQHYLRQGVWGSPCSRQWVQDKTLVDVHGAKSTEAPRF
jgi:hypothetical protein